MVTHRPEKLEKAFRIARQTQQSGDQVSARKLYIKLLNLLPKDVEILNSLGSVELQGRNLEQAMEIFQQSLDVDPKSAETLGLMALTEKRMGNWRRALLNYEAAISIDHQNAVLWNNSGVLLVEMERYDEAIFRFRKSIDLEWDYQDAHRNLLENLEKSNQLPELEEAISRAAAAKVPSDCLLVYKARICEANEDYERAKNFLRQAVKLERDSHLVGKYQFLLGNVYDGLGCFSDAMHHYQRANLIRASSVDIDAFKKVFSDRLDKIESWLDSQESLKEKIEENKKESCDSPIFIVGFPRSGTTLLDSILRSSDELVVLEEKPILSEVRISLEKLESGYPFSIDDLGFDDLQSLRAQYFEKAEEFIEPNDRCKRIVDKLPLNCVDVGIINKIFPDAKIVFVRRHPLDCVLSAFFQDFVLNAPMSHFTTLDDTAALYDRVLNLWMKAKDAFDLNVVTFAYEELISKQEDTTQSLFASLGITWTNSALDFRSVALERKRINTPSYKQVVQPLYNKSTFRWMNYREHLVEVESKLQEWIIELGYSDEQDAL